MKFIVGHKIQTYMLKIRGLVLCISFHDRPSMFGHNPLFMKIKASALCTCGLPILTTGFVTPFFAIGWSIHKHNKKCI